MIINIFNETVILAKIFSNSVGGRRGRNGRGMTLRERSAMLRKEAVNFLDGGVGGGKLSAAAARNRVLFLQGKENLTAEELPDSTTRNPYTYSPPTAAFPTLHREDKSPTVTTFWPSFHPPIG